eukprot:gene5335-5571_t
MWQVLVNWLEQQQVQPSRTAPTHVNPPAYTIQSCRVLEVSAAAVDAFLEQQRELLLQTAGETFGQPVVLLHLGVDTQRPGLNLESQAFNNATFRWASLSTGSQACRTDDARQSGKIANDDDHLMMMGAVHRVLGA